MMSLLLPIFHPGLLYQLTMGATLIFLYLNNTPEAGKIKVSHIAPETLLFILPFLFHSSGSEQKDDLLTAFPI